MTRNVPEILFISSNVGLGHITRDLAIAKELRKNIPSIKISWVAAPPVSDYLRENNETLLPESKLWPSDILIAEKTSDGINLNLVKYLVNANESWDQQWKLFQEIIDKYSFDLIVGDETYRIDSNLSESALMNQPLTNTPFVMIYDFLLDRAMTDDPKENELVRNINGNWLRRMTSKFPEGIPAKLISRFFVGEIDDLEDRVTNKGVIDVKEAVKDSIIFLGNIIRFDPETYKNSRQIREKLGYKSSPLIVCSVGGSNVGLSLLKLCLESYKILEKKVPGLQMALVCGPRINPSELDIPKGVVAHGYVSNLIEHFAACDLGIIQLGLSSSMELIALQKPFIYFPIPQHFEQDDMANRFRRRGVGFEMSIKSATPDTLANTIMDKINLKVNYPIKNFNGAKNAAKYIKELISLNS
jgi:UDP:flavonoid glycosyltransferase YjiC (YdhE family)